MADGGADAPDGLGASHFDSKSDENRELEFVKEWFPDSDDYRGKTKITGQQARALAVLRHLDELLPEFIDEDTNEMLVSLAENIERYQTSISGESREQQQEILKLVGGGQQNELANKQSGLMSAFMSDMNDDE